jgi:hypothetical protein
MKRVTSPFTVWLFCSLLAVGCAARGFNKDSRVLDSQQSSSDSRTLPRVDEMTYPQFSSFVASDCEIYDEVERNGQFQGKARQRIPEARKQLSAAGISEMDFFAIRNFFRSSAIRGRRLFTGTPPCVTATQTSSSSRGTG